MEADRLEAGQNSETGCGGNDPHGGHGTYSVCRGEPWDDRIQIIVF
jgi:hypothetical protein